MKCNKCGYSNKENAKFCRNCGASIEQQKKSLLIWIIVSLGIICLVVLVKMSNRDENDRYYYDNSYLNNEREYGEVENNIEENDDNYYDDFDLNINSEYENSENDDFQKYYSRDVIKSICLDINSNIIRLKSNYSAPAVIEIILDLKGINTSQNVLAEQLNIVNGGPADYNMVTSILNNKLYDTSYSGYYYDKEEMEYFDKYMFELEIDRDLEDGYPLIVCINGKEFGGSDTTAYAVVYGVEKKLNNETIYQVYSPVNHGEFYRLTFSELLGAMEASGFVCFIQ